MTANQINYFRAQEEQRHNMVLERHEHRQVAASEMQARASTTQAEAAKMRQVEEVRHNQNTEAINWFQAERDAELKRAQVSSLDVQAQAAKRQAEAATTQAAASMLQAQTRANELSESIRHNQSLENESRRHNLMAEEQASRQTSVQSAYNVAQINQKQQELDRKQKEYELDLEKQKVNVFNAYTAAKSAQGALLRGEASQLDAQTRHEAEQRNTFKMLYDVGKDILSNFY